MGYLLLLPVDRYGDLSIARLVGMQLLLQLYCKQKDAPEHMAKLIILVSGASTMDAVEICDAMHSKCPRMRTSSSPMRHVYILDTFPYAS